MRVHLSVIVELDIEFDFDAFGTVPLPDVEHSNRSNSSDFCEDVELDPTNRSVCLTRVHVELVDPLPFARVLHDDGPPGMNELLEISGVEVAAFTYTPNGDLWTKTQAGVTWTYAYTEAGLLKEVKEGSTVRAKYAYDGLGRRVKAVENGVTTFFVYGLGIDPVWTKTGTTETRHVYANGKRIAS